MEMGCGELLQRIQELEEQLEQKECRDEMTNMFNRNGLQKRKEEIAQKALLPGYRLFAFVADLNSLKYINDNFGHGEGDKAIQVLGNILLESAKDKVECFRIGGDEFELLGALPEDDTFAAEFVQEVEERIRNYNDQSSLPYSLEASYGCIFEPMSYAEDLDEYVKLVDRRMYEMKRRMRETHTKVQAGWAEEMRSVDLGRDKILIADDDRLIRLVLKSFFQDHELIVEADNGKEALEQIEKERFTLICLDLHMPVMDGFDVLRVMAERQIPNQAPIIMITGCEDEQIEEQGYRAGVADFIKKPFNFVIAKHRIDNILSLYKKQYQLELMLKEKDTLVKTQVRQLVKQARRLGMEES